MYIIDQLAILNLTGTDLIECMYGYTEMEALATYFDIYHKELYSVDIICENRTSTIPVSRGEGWVFSCLSSYI